MSYCDGCAARVLWLANDKTGKAAPVDPTPVPNGNVTVDFASSTYHVMTKKEVVAADNGLGDLFDPPPDRFTLHFATCPHADHFRRCHTCHKSPCVCAKD